MVFKDWCNTFKLYKPKAKKKWKKLMIKMNRED